MPLSSALAIGGGEGPPGSSISGASVRRGDKVFRGVSRGAGIFVLLLMALIGAFLIWKAIPSLTTNSANFFTEQQWLPDQTPPVFGIAVLAFGTLVTAVIAMVLAVPVGYGIALFIAYYAHRRVAAVLAFVVDLLAAVPSIIFGLWGLQFLMPNMEGLMAWLATYFGWIPLFANDQQLYTKSIMIAGVVLAIMILPTVSALSREVFVQVPRTHVEASLALGATRWEMVRMAVVPFSKPGMISAAMLGLGRALGETIAVALILSAVFDINWHITEPGGNSFAANIALKWGEAQENGRSALIASGLVLFLITLLVNMAARAIIARRKEFSGAN
ncbi:MAG: phosphate ABC transporter permease subunit PstC [Actinomycetota bacterium]|nr:MAG: phosphate ABC transporter permease subunit PstC [Actinomycetota bacterium]